MNTPSAIETKSSFSFKDALFKAVPESFIGRILIWGTLPAALLLFTTGVNFLCASPFSLYLPFLALFGGLLCLRWKTIGLCGSYLALGLLVVAHFRDIPHEERLWQMGIAFALAVDFFILLLAAEEIEALIGKMAESLQLKTKEYHQAHLQLQQTNLEKEELQKSFEEEIQRLKAEAEQRRIEKQQEEKRVELIQSEIELLTSQKAVFVAEAKKARAILEQDGEAQKVIQEAEAKIASLETQLLELSEELACIRTSKEEFEEKCTQLASQSEAFQSENKTLHTQIADLNQKLSRLSSENERRVAALTEGDASIIEALLSTQEKVIARQLSPVVIVDDKQLRQLNGLHKQLRTQFEDKARILTETRKELFQAQEKLLALQHEQQLAEFAPDLEEASGYENVINRVSQELSYLEEEVQVLEELLSISFQG